MSSRWSKEDGLSSAQNQKFRSKHSSGVTSASAHLSRMSTLRVMECSRRSFRPTTHPIPPSDMQILMSGYLTGINEYKKSTVGATAYVPKSTPVTPIGASGAVDGRAPAEPV